MKATTTLILLLISVTTWAQAPLVEQWDYRFGGMGEEDITFLTETPDKGFILGGYSKSDANGDKSQPNWDISAFTFDYWIVKIDSIGNKLWDKRFGGTNDERLYAVQLTSDSGFILGGVSKSGISGDKTQSNWNPADSSFDFWIIKIDQFGNTEWDRRFGGLINDILVDIKQTSDDGFILGGYSNSDVSGDKTQPCWGYDDYWICKIDVLGNLEWEKRFGGLGRDMLYSVDQTSDNGYILAGTSTSDISGDKTVPSWGYGDYWILKIDSTGVIEWQKRFGGTANDVLSSMTELPGGDYIVAGTSESNDGDVTGPTWGLADYWAVRIDQGGNKIWDKNFGGTVYEDELSMISIIDNLGFLLSGTSYSDASGNKTEDNLGLEQGWVVKADLSGNLVWDKTIFTLGHDEMGYAVKTDDGCFLMGINTNADVGGYKTQTSWNSSYDYWIVKFCDTTDFKTNIIESDIRNTTVVFPNPFTTTATITINQPGRFDFMLYDVYGRTVNISRFEISTFQIVRNNLPAGIYFYRVEQESKLIGSGKVVVE